MDSYDDEKGERTMSGAGENEQLQSLDDWGKEYQKQLSDLSKMNAESLVGIAENIGKFLTKGRYQKGKYEQRMNLKVNQIRRFLDAVRRIEADLKGKQFEDVRDSIMLLRPKLAYAAGREEQVKPLMRVLDPAIRSAATAGDDKNFRKLLRLIEAIIAYHNFHGGSN